MTKLIAIGDLNLDILHSPRKRAKLGEEAFSAVDFSVGGNAANFAYACAKLGTNVQLISTIGNDFSRKFLLNVLKNAGVSLRLERSKGPNGCSVIFVNKHGERRIYSKKGVLLNITAKLVEKKLDAKAGDMVYFGGYFHLANMHKGFNKLLKKLKRKGCTVLFDTCFDEYGNWKLPQLRYIDYLFINEVELRHVARGSNEKKKVEHLLRRGSRNVILKKGEQGATFYSKQRRLHVKGIITNVVDTTAAGDLFNAGFVYGLVNGFSMMNCLRFGRFVAVKKIQAHGLVVPSKNEISKFYKQNLLDVDVVRGYAEMSRKAASEIIEQVNQKPDSLIVLATGNTPTGAYRYLVKSRTDFSKASFAALDEYVGMNEKDRNSFGYYLNRHFFSKVRVKRKYLLNGKAKPGNECKRYEHILKKPDFILLGIGVNGHIAFNEPGTGFRTKTHVARLTKSTVAVNTEKTGSAVPDRGITVGLGTIMRAKRILLIANGSRKRDAIKKLVKGKITERVPATVLQKHRNAKILADRKAGAGL